MMVPHMGANPYMKYNISDTVPIIVKWENRKKYKELIEQLLKSPGNNIIVIGDSNNISNITVGNVTNIKQAPYQLTKDWIAANPPNNASKNNYYKAYSASDNFEDITKNMFSRIMTQIGYKGGHTSGSRVWLTLEKNK